MSVIKTPLTELREWEGGGEQGDHLQVHPVVLAGMFVASGPRLAAAVTNAGGLGVIGGLALTPSQLKKQIAELKAGLKDKSAPFGIDLALPKIGGGARKTNHDYTHGHLNELVDIIIAEKAKLFVCAIGVCPPEIVDRLHKGNVLVANMIGHPKHVPKVIDAGVDIVCAQAGEGGGHTGAIPFSTLIPSVVDECSRRKSKAGRPIHVMAAGGIFDGRGLASALMYGAEAVWVGTRFVASVEANAPMAHKKEIVSTGFDGTERTLIYSGRPMRVKKTAYVAEWNDTRAKEIEELTSRGIVPHAHELDKKPNRSIEGKPWIMGVDAAMINDIPTAKEIVDGMVNDARKAILVGASDLKSKL